MKKILALILAIVMLMSFCAAAETDAAARGYRFELKDIVLNVGETNIDLTGLGLGMSLYQNENDMGLRIALNTAEEEALALNAAMVDGQLLLSMTGVSAVYSLNLVEIIGIAEAFLNSVDFGDMFFKDIELAESMDIETIEEVAEETAEDADEEIAEETAAETDAEAVEEETAISFDIVDGIVMGGLLLEAAALVYEGISDEGTKEIDGIAYDVINIDVAPETLQPILDEFVSIMGKYVEGDGSRLDDFVTFYNSEKPSLELDSTYMNSDENFILDFELSSETEKLEKVNAFQLYMDGKVQEDESFQLHTNIAVAVDDIITSLKYDVVWDDDADGSWIPSAEQTVDIFEVFLDEESRQILVSEATNAGIMALMQIIMTNEALSNMLFGSLMV